MPPKLGLVLLVLTASLVIFGGCSPEPQYSTAGTTAQAPTKEEVERLINGLVTDLQVKIKLRDEAKGWEQANESKRDEAAKAKELEASLSRKQSRLQEWRIDLTRLLGDPLTRIVAAAAGFSIGGLLSGLLFLRVVWREKITKGSVAPGAFKPGSSDEVAPSIATAPTPTSAPTQTPTPTLRTIPAPTPSATVNMTSISGGPATASSPPAQDAENFVSKGKALMSSQSQLEMRGENLVEQKRLLVEAVSLLQQGYNIYTRSGPMARVAESSDLLRKAQRRLAIITGVVDMNPHE